MVTLHHISIVLKFYYIGISIKLEFCNIKNLIHWNSIMSDFHYKRISVTWELHYVAISMLDVCYAGIPTVRIPLCHNFHYIAISITSKVMSEFVYIVIITMEFLLHQNFIFIYMYVEMSVILELHHVRISVSLEFLLHWDSVVFEFSWIRTPLCWNFH